MRRPRSHTTSRKSDRQLDIVRTYYGPTAKALSKYDVTFAERPNTILEMMWNPTVTWGTIAQQNTTIDAMAKSIMSLRESGSPTTIPQIMLSVWHEPENDVSPGGDPNCPGVTYRGKAGTVAQYRNMWAYVENRFALDGVTNVIWSMDYMNYTPWKCLYNDLYPGTTSSNGSYSTPTATGTRTSTTWSVASTVSSSRTAMRHMTTCQRRGGLPNGESTA